MFNLTTQTKSGYLKQDFRLFHIKDQVEKEFDFHYHDFHKIIVFLSGKVTYIIEGKSYFLKPWDIILVSQYDIHKPVIDPSVPYERIILWVKDDFIKSYNNDVCDITACFQKANDRSFNLVRLPQDLLSYLQELLRHLEDALSSEEFGASLLSSSLFVQFMVYLNRIFLGKQYIRDSHAYLYDSKVEEILKYINSNLTDDLSIDALSARFFISKYHLMRKFKEDTGYTVHNYIIQKRLLYARQMIKNNMPVIQASHQCGFQDYTTFYRAYKKMFHQAPTELI